MISCHRFKTGQVRPANITTAAFYMRKVIKMVVYVFFHLQVFRLFCITPYIFPAIILWQYILAGYTFVVGGGGGHLSNESSCATGMDGTGVACWRPSSWREEGLASVHKHLFSLSEQLIFTRTVFLLLSGRKTAEGRNTPAWPLRPHSCVRPYVWSRPVSVVHLGIC